MHNQVEVRPSVAIGIEIDTRNDPSGYGDSVASDWITDDTHLGFEFWDNSDFEILEAFEGGEIIDFEEGEVAIVGDMKNAGRMLLCRSVFGDEESAGIGNHVCIGKDAVLADDESGANTPTELSGLPWLTVVGDLCGHFDSYDGAVDALSLGWCDLWDGWAWGNGWWSRLFQSLGLAIAGDAKDEQTKSRGKQG